MPRRRDRVLKQERIDAPLSRTMQALVSSISSSAPVLGAMIDSGTKLAVVVA